MARNRVKVSPKTSSHSAGWSARVISSVWSWRSFCCSTRHMVPIRETTRRGRPIGTDSPQPASGPASCSDIAHPFSGITGQPVAGGGAEHVVEGGARADTGFELGRCAQRADPTAGHQGYPVAVLVGLLHVVRGHAHGHPGYRTDIRAIAPHARPAER